MSSGFASIAPFLANLGRPPSPTRVVLRLGPRRSGDAGPPPHSGSPAGPPAHLALPVPHWFLGGVCDQRTPEFGRLSPDGRKRRPHDQQTFFEPRQVANAPFRSARRPAHLFLACNFRHWTSRKRPRADNGLSAC